MYFTEEQLKSKVIEAKQRLERSRHPITIIEIKEFNRIGLEITWCLLEIGLNGERQFTPQLRPEDIIEYATQKLLENIEASRNIVLLAGANKSDIEEIKQLLRKLSEEENVDRKKEFRKWRVIYILSVLSNLSTDYVQGLLDIGDAWAMFDFPDDSPHIFQGKGNAIKPKEYYTQNNFDSILQLHKEWLEREIQYLKN